MQEEERIGSGLNWNQFVKETEIIRIDTKRRIGEEIIGELMP